MTHIQGDELAATSDTNRKQLLLKTLTKVDPQSLSTDTAVWNDSKWGKTKWSARDGMYRRLLHRIRELDDAKGRKPSHPMNQSRDARIAETAIKTGLTLVTNDRSLTQATAEAGGIAITFEAFASLN